jgi:hypothetical protein
MRMQYRHISATKDACSGTSRHEFIQQYTYCCPSLYKSLHIHHADLVGGTGITNYGIPTLTNVYALYAHSMFTEKVNETAAYPGTQFASRSCDL